jgi:hypothetical protein
MVRLGNMESEWDFSRKGLGEALHQFGDSGFLVIQEYG